MRTDIDKIKREQDQDENLELSFSGNPIKVAIQNLFKNELHEHSWAKYTLADMKALVDTTLTTVNRPGPWSSGTFSLLNKIKKTKDTKTILFILNEYLFS